MWTHALLTLDSDFLRILTLGVTATHIGSVCHKCGITKKYGKLSCCGRGGSWFGNCGSAGLGYTWHEGIRACKARQYRTAVGQQLRVSQSKPSISSDGAIAGVDSKAVITASHVFASTPANTSMPFLVTTRTSTMPDPKSPANPTIHPPANLTINLLSNPAIIQSMASASADMSMMTSSHTSAGRALFVRECEKLLHVAIFIGMMLETFC